VPGPQAISSSYLAVDTSGLNQVLIFFVNFCGFESWTLKKKRPGLCLNGARSKTKKASGPGS